MDRDDLIVQDFSYLIDDFGFHIDAQEFVHWAFGNAFVIFKSPSAGIEIVIDRNQAFIRIGNPSQPTATWIEFSVVLKYLAPTEIAYDFGEKTNRNTWDEVVEAQLSRLAVILRQHCAALLSGAFPIADVIADMQTRHAAELEEWFKQQSQTHH